MIKRFCCLMEINRTFWLKGEASDCPKYTPHCKPRWWQNHVMEWLEMDVNGVKNRKTKRRSCPQQKKLKLIQKFTFQHDDDLEHTTKATLYHQGTKKDALECPVRAQRNPNETKSVAQPEDCCLSKLSKENGKLTIDFSRMIKVWCAQLIKA